ncbi:hypothetical protein LguiA_003760 [Lonicera macranthoides]
MWDSFKDIAMQSNIPWQVARDLNDMVTSSEKIGGGEFNYQRVAKFNSMMNECRLIDLGWNGTSFTWMGKRRGGVIVKERLDIALTNEEWCINFSDTTVLHLLKILSDHHLILIDLKTFLYPRGPKAI